MNKIITSFLLLLGIAYSCTSTYHKNNDAIKLGIAKICVELKDGKDTWPDSLLVGIVNIPILSPELTFEDYKLTLHDSVYVGTIPMELKYTNYARLVFQTPSRSFYKSFIVGLHQDKPLNVKIQRDSDSTYTFSADGGTGFIMEGAPLSDYVVRFCIIDNFDLLPLAHYDTTTWEPYIHAEIDTILPILYSRAKEASPNLPEKVRYQVDEFLKRDYYCHRVSRFVAITKKLENRDVPEPPIEFHKAYIDSMDFSPEVMLDDSYHPGMLRFLKVMLHTPTFEIDSIGEENIEQWITRTRPKVQRVITAPSPLFMQLLSAVSYLSQVEDYHIPLTEKQIRNINEYYKDDLGKIVLRRNDVIAKKLAKGKPELINLADSAQKFDLAEFLNRFNDEPVIIDFWNTWCAPCRAAMNEVGNIKEDLNRKGINFVYIADTSSPEKIWSSMAELESGIQLRLSETDIDELTEKYNIEAIPFYMFFNAKHELVETQIGFPGIVTFMELAEKITE